MDRPSCHFVEHCAERTRTCGRQALFIEPGPGGIDERAPANRPHPMNTSHPDSRELAERYTRLRSQLSYAVHELPAGVLYGFDGADAGQCAEWMADLHEFETICTTLGHDHRAFIDDCRWHFEHYPHYLGRRRHFVDYRKYIEDRGGPVRVRGS